MKIRTACILILPFLFFTSKITYGANLCDYYFKRMEYERAIEECTRAINSADKNSAIIYEYYSTRGTVYKIIGKYDEALSDFNSAVKSGTESKARLSITYNDRGNLYQLKGLYDHAISDYEKAIELDQDSYIGTYNIASLFALMNYADLSCKWLRKSIENGFSIWRHAFKKEKDLDNIRNSACYKEIMAGK